MTGEVEVSKVGTCVFFLPRLIRGNSRKLRGEARRVPS